MFVSYSADNDRIFAQGIARARQVTDDLRTPFQLIAADFYKSEKAIFQLSGPGQYPDLSESYKKKLKRLGIAIYPMLKRSGLLEEAATEPGSSGNVTVISKDNLTMGIDGSVVRYAIYHQSNQPRRKLPQRKVIFIGPEAPQFANSDQVGRLERWLNIMNSFIMQKLKQQGFDVYIGKGGT